MADITFGIRLVATDDGMSGTVKVSRQELEKLSNAGNAASSSLREMDAEMKRSMASAVALGTAVAQFAVEAGKQMAAWAKETIAATSALGNLSTATGSSVEALSALTNSFKVSGVDSRTLEAALQRLAVGLSGTDEESSKAGKALAALGIQSRDPATALRELAVKLEEYKDGADKAAYVQTILGRGAQVLLPALRDLATGTDAVTTVTKQQAEEADRLEKSWRRLSIEGSALRTMLLNDIVPALGDMIEQFIRGRQIAGGFWAAVWNFGTMKPVNSAVDALNLVAEINTKIANIERANASAPKPIQGELVQVTQLKQQLQYIQTVLLPQFQRAYRSLETEFGGVDEAIARQAAGWKELPKPAADASDAVKEQRDAWESLIISLEKAAVSQAKLGKEAEIEVQLQQRQYQGTTMRDAAMRLYAKALAAAEDEQKRLNDATRAGAVADKAYTEALQAEVAAANKQASAAEASAQKLEDELATFGLSRTALLDLTIARKEDQLARLTDYDNYIPEYVAALESEIDALKRTRAAVQGLETARANKENAEQAQRSWAQMIDSVASSFGNFLVDLVDNGSSAFKNLWNSFKNWALRALAEVAAKQIVVSIVGAVSGVGAGSAAASGLGALSTGSSLLGGLGSVGTIGGAIFGGAGTAIAGTIGTVGSAGAMGAVAAGAEAAGLAAPTIGSALAGGLTAGLAAIPVAGWIAIGALIIGGIALGMDKGNAMRTGTWMSSTGDMPRGNPLFQGSSAFGSFGVVDDKWFSDSDMGEQFSAFIKGIESIDNAIAKMVGSDMTSRISVALASATQTFEAGMEHESITYGDIMIQRYRIALNTIDDGLGEFLVGFNGTAEEFATFTIALVAMSNVMKDTTAMTATFGESFDLDTLKGMQQEGEQITDTFKRLWDTFTATNLVALTLGKTSQEAFGAVGLASYDTRQALVDLAGGLDVLASRANFYFQNFLTPGEQLASTTSHVRAEMDRLGLSGVTTVEQFKAVVNGIDLNTEAGRALYTALMAIAPEFYSVATEGERAAQAAKELAAAVASATDSFTEAVMKYNGATDVELRRFNANTALAAVRTIPGLENASILDLVGLTPERIAELKLTPAQINLITQAVNAHTALNKAIEEETKSINATISRRTGSGTPGSSPSNRIDGRPGMTYDTSGLDAVNAGLSTLLTIADPLGAATASLASDWDKLTAQSDSLATMTAYYDGSAESTERLAQATQEYYQSVVKMLAAIQQIKQSVSDLFNSNIRTFTLSGLDKQGQYAYLQAETEAWKEELKTATDPARINWLTSHIAQNQMAAWNLLDPAEQAQVRQQFIDGAKEADRIAQERLDKASQAAQERYDKMIADVKGVLEEAGRKFGVAGDKQIDAGNRMQEAANDMRNARITVDVQTPKSPRVGTY